MARKYEKRKRAEQQDDTRRRIVEATVELHQEVGPARTQIVEIARRAGVQRPTIYRHFPDQESLLGACSAHYVAQNPPPDPAAWAAIADPAERLRAALDDLYAYYEATEAMRTNITRDAQLMPVLGRLISQRWVPWMAAVTQILATGWGVRGQRRKRRFEAAIALGLQFHTWRTLVREQGLGRADAVDVSAGAIRAAAG